MFAVGGKSHFRFGGGIIRPIALPRRLLLAVVRTQSSAPSADSASAAALDVLQNFISPEAINQQLLLIMTGPIAFTLAAAIDKQLANAMSAD
jgi:hypothetical protein